MNIKAISLTLFFIPFMLFSSEAPDAIIIKGASYYIIQGNEHSIFQGIGSDSEYVTFFDADGNELTRMNHTECDLFRVKYQLDPDAPKPKIATYAIKWWPAFRIDYGMRKGCPGYFLVLKDKHGNYIKSFRYDEETKTISIIKCNALNECTTTIVSSVYELEDFDTQDAKEVGSDEIDRSIMIARMIKEEKQLVKALPWKQKIKYHLVRNFLALII